MNISVHKLFKYYLWILLSTYKRWIKEYAWRNNDYLSLHKAYVLKYSFGLNTLHIICLQIKYIVRFLQLFNLKNRPYAQPGYVSSVKKIWIHYNLLILNWKNNSNFKTTFFRDYKLYNVKRITIKTK